MIPHSFTSEGFVLARRNFGEADRIIDVYSKEKGKISLIAKGVRRPKSRKRGHIEVFSRVNFQAVSGKGIDIMTEAEMIDNYKEIRQSLKKISLAYYFMEVIGKITHESEINIRVYELLSVSLEKLRNTIFLKKLRLEFVKNLIIILGFWPENKVLPDIDEKLEEILERQIFSNRVGKRVLSNVK
jgi:DNA repair protein RecO (recombination protein O)